MAKLEDGKTHTKFASRELGFSMSYEDLADIHDILHSRFHSLGVDGEDKQVTEMRRRCCSAAFYNVLTLAGWTMEKFEDILYSKAGW